MLKLFRPPRWVERIFPLLTWRLVVSRPVVFLTFDDGPHPDITPFVLDRLKEHGMKATFFCVGENLVRYPELAQRLIAEGHTIGNHTMRHSNGLKVSNKEYTYSVYDFQTVYRATLFRPPYGRMRKAQREQLQKEFRIIMWSLLTYDFDPSVSDEKILAKISTVKKGEIVVLHDNPKFQERLKRLLPEILELLKSKGFSSEAITS
jgi:peptidoglycan-N-acetylglucosamine deacetylase